MPTQQMLLSGGKPPADIGQDAYTTMGTYTWTCPANTEYISVFVCSGGGAGGGRAQQWSYGGGGQGGNTAWRNGLAVTAGQNYTVVVGHGGYSLNGNQINGGDSYFNGTSNTTTNVFAPGGYKGETCNNCSAGASGYMNSSNFVGDPNGLGWGGIGGTGASGSGGGGGCAGYNGNGGIGSHANYGSQVGWYDKPGGTYSSMTHPTCGYYGGGGGGHHRWGSHYGNSGGAGGGIGIYGRGSSGCPHGGAGQRPGASAYNWGYGGYGGSSGAAGGNGAYNSAGIGGNYGGGGGGSGGLPTTGGNGGGGFVRILYPGDQRSWPTTRTGIE